MVKREVFKNEGKLYIKSLDIQVTEHCSLRCKDCSNLMQYYSKTKNSNIDILFSSIDRFMSCVDQLYEFRVIGGDPFMNKDMYKIVNFLSNYKVETIAIYTNVKFIPKGENFECLKNPKVILDISDYVLLDKSKRKADELVSLLDKNNIKYNLAKMKTWTDSGRILPFQKRSEDELKNLFNFCCNSDIISLLHGNLYRCPFSANASNLKAVPIDDTDIVNLYDSSIDLKDLKMQIQKLVYEKEYLTACNYCNGRDFSTKKIDAAIQAPTNKALYFKSFD
jgi:organic radical activating enzyme